MSERTVYCAKLKKEAPGLAAPPFGGELGHQIFDHVSEEVWRQWNDEVMIKIINEYRLDMTDPKQYDMLLEQMRAFLGLEESKQVLEVENEARGRGK